MKHIKRTDVLSGGILVIAVMGANIVNFVFNAFLGRALSFEEFGLITFISTLFYIVNIFYNALSQTVNHKVAYEHNKKSIGISEQFLGYVTKRTLFINIVFMCLWILCTPFITIFFHINNAFVIYLFALVILFYPFIFINRGYLQGKFLFLATALTIIIEPVIKFTSSLFFVSIHQESMTYISLYISSLTIVFFSGLIVLLRKQKTGYKKKTHVHFPITFYIAALMTGLSTISFLAIDLILVKHYVNPKLAGQYALLSLVGKIIYFLGSLLNVFTISLVSRDEGIKKNSRVSFYKLLTGSIVLAGVGYVFLGLFGSIFVPLLLGKKAFAIVSFVNLYCLSILLFTIANNVVTYHLAKKQYIFPIIALLMSTLMVVGIMLYHQSILQIIQTIFIIGIVNSIVLFLFHIKFANQKLVLLKTLSKEEGLYD